MKDELSIIQKTFDMLLWLIPKIDRFPRNQKFLLGERIERTAPVFRSAFAVNIYSSLSPLYVTPLVRLYPVCGPVKLRNNVRSPHEM